MGKLRAMNWSLVGVITLICCIGFVLLYSVAGGSFEPWADRQIVRFGIGMLILLAVALIDIRVWFQLAYPIYGVSLLLLVAGRVHRAHGQGRGALDRDRAAAIAAVGADEDRFDPGACRAFCTASWSRTCRGRRG